MSQIKDMTGQTFGRLTVKELAPKPWKNQKREAEWVCICSCGNNTVAQGHEIRRGNNKSCGCLKQECLEMKQQPVHGHSRRGKSSPTYNTWQRMKERCLNSNHHNYPYYGGRGITVCNRWLNSFKNFLEDMGERPEDRTIDRIDVDGNYEPSNCRWATAKEQRANRRV